MRDAVIVEAVRTPVGKRGGALAGMHPADLSAIALQALAERTEIEPGLIDDVIWGCVGQVGEQSFDIARTAVLSAGWPESVPGTTVDRQCGSSQQAVHFAAAAVMSGQCDLVVAGGVEAMSRIPLGTSIAVGGNPFGGTGWTQRYDGAIPNQGIGGEMIAAKWGLTRERLDEFGARSQHLATAARDAGRFDKQIVAVETRAVNFSSDEGIREGTTAPRLAGLKPAFGGLLTAGSSSQISDGAAALLVTTSQFAAAHGLTPIVRVHTTALAGDDPIMMLTAPIPATAKALERAGLAIGDIGVYEVNEAFASVPLAWLAETGADEARLNPNGGAIALGHPLGASGARIMTTLVHHMRDVGIQYGLQTMCEGGGQANATILELLT